MIFKNCRRGKFSSAYSFRILIALTFCIVLFVLIWYEIYYEKCLDFNNKNCWNLQPFNYIKIDLQEKLYQFPRKSLQLKNIKRKKKNGSRRPEKTYQYFTGSSEIKSSKKCSTVSPLLGNLKLWKQAVNIF
jgi:hypothetical protein